MKNDNDRERLTPLLLSVDTAAQLLGIGRSKCYELVTSGALRSVRIGRARRIPTSELSRYCADLAAHSGDDSP